MNEDSCYDPKEHEGKTWFIGKIDDGAMLEKLEQMVAECMPKEVYLMGGSTLPEESIEGFKQAVKAAGGSVAETKLGVRYSMIAGYSCIPTGEDMMSLGRAPSWKTLSAVASGKYRVEEAAQALESMLDGDVLQAIISGDYSMYAHIENSVLDSGSERGIHASWPSGKQRTWTMSTREPTIFEVGPVSQGLILTEGEEKDGYRPINYLQIGL